MKTFKHYFEQTEAHVETGETVALFPGGFKPPTKGHFFALEQLLAETNTGIIFVGKSPRDGITQQMSCDIWRVYAPYLSRAVTIVPSPISPVKSVYDIIESEYSGKKRYIVGAGAKDEDITRYNSILKNPQKYPLVFVKKIDMQGGGISGTKVREGIMRKDPDVIDFFVPDVLSETSKEAIRDILRL